MSKAYTHVGWLGVRAYQSFDSYWHGDGPKPAKRHACNQVKPGVFKALCGRRVVPNRDGVPGAGDMLEWGDVTTVVPAGELGITCRRCRRVALDSPHPDR